MREHQWMLIRAYGLFWRVDEVNWQPGRGSRGEFMLLGRQGKNQPKIQLADFRRQSGLYILYAITVLTTSALRQKAAWGGDLKAIT